MDNFVGIYYWIRLGILVLLSVLALVSGVRLARSRKFSAGKGVAVVVLELIALIGGWLMTGASPSPVWIVVLLVVGVVLGFLAGRTSKPYGEALRRSPLGAAVSAIAFVFLAMTLLFGTSYLFSIALLGVALATGILAGQLAGEMQAGKSAATPPPFEAAAPPPFAPPPLPTE